MKIILILFVLLLPILSRAQQSDSQLAYTYYQAKEYDKAADKFLKLYERTHAANYLDYYIICLINGKKYDRAEEELKKFLKTDGNNKDFLINLGYIYDQQGKNRKSEECYQKAVQKLIPQNADISNLANKFKNIREYSWAIRTYQRGQELLKKPDAYLKELGDCYLLERDYEQMMKLFVRVLEINPASLNSVTAQLSFARLNDIINSIDSVIEKTLAAQFKQPDYNPVFDELGVWYNLQIQNYSQALRQAVLLNDKIKDKIHIFLNVARDAAEAGKYDIAVDAYQKVLDKGKENNNYYVTARKGSLLCRYDRVRHSQSPASAFPVVAGEMEKYLQEYGFTTDNIDVLTLLSDLYAYELRQPDSANVILEKAIRIPRINPNTLSMLKSKRADLLAFMDNPWEATILYTQIEKANPNNETGYEAKLKKAWLAYYSGDLLWAKAQFDVLKGATSKLVSNDAIQMAHFINMNYEAEQDNQDLEKLARTEYLLYKKQYQTALPLLDSLTSCEAPGIAEHASLVKVRLLTEQLQYDAAVKILEYLKDHSEQTYIQAEAIFKLAQLKARLNDKLQAKELYKLLVSEYSGSVYSVEAGRLYREGEKNSSGVESGQ